MANWHIAVYGKLMKTAHSDWLSDWSEFWSINLQRKKKELDQISTQSHLACEYSRLSAKKVGCIRRLNHINTVYLHRSHTEGHRSSRFRPGDTGESDKLLTKSIAHATSKKSIEQPASSLCQKFLCGSLLTSPC